MKITTRQLALCAVLTALALGLSTLENLFPVTLVIPLPGVKLGLANIVTVYAVFALGPGDALLILLSRVFLGAVFSGQMMTLFYSLGGGLLAWLAPGQEPTEHLLRELLDEDLQGVPLTLLVPDAGSLRNETLRRFCEKNPDVPVLLDGDARTAETAARQTFAEAGKLPLLVVLRGPLTAAYAVSGYHVGSAALALRVWQAVRP